MYTVHSFMNCVHKGHSRLISLAVEEVGMGVCPAGGDRGTFPHWGHSRLISLAVEEVGMGVIVVLLYCCLSVMLSCLPAVLLYCYTDVSVFCCTAFLLYCCTDVILYLCYYGRRDIR